MEIYATPNLPSRDFDTTEAFYARLGFVRAFRDDGWMILERGDAVLEFFPHPNLDPADSWFSACLRTDDLDALHAECIAAGLKGPHDTVRITDELRMYPVIDLDGTLIRCIGA